MKTARNPLKILLPERPSGPCDDHIRPLFKRWLAHQDKVALSIREKGELQTFTYGRIIDVAQGIAQDLRSRGLRRPRVALLAESRPEWPILLLGAFLGGAEVVALDPQLKDLELNLMIRRSAIDMLVTSRRHEQRSEAILPHGTHLCLEDFVQAVARGDLQPQNQDPLEFDLDRPFLNVFGSGTTGVSRIIMISGRNLLYQAHENAARVSLRGDDRVLSILPINHLFELSAGTLAPLYLCCTVHYANTLMPHEIVAALGEQRITRMIGVPIFFKALKRSIELQIEQLGMMERLSLKSLMSVAKRMPLLWRARVLPFRAKLGGHLRDFTSGGAALPSSVSEFFELIGIPVYQGYGLSEAAPVVSANSIDDNKPASCGKPLSGTELRVLEPDEDGIGEILVRGPQVMLGYWNDSETSHSMIDQEGWLHTGDKGYLDRDGFLFITGRSRNLIVLGGGKKIFPEEVELELSGLSSAVEFCVTSIKSQEWEEPVLVAVPTPYLIEKLDGDNEAIRAEIMDEMRRHLAQTADYKHPKKVLLVTALPRTSTGKVKIGELQKRLQVRDYY